jgi:PBP1b-binding outer membrane lipoprotein LpoB
MKRILLFILLTALFLTACGASAAGPEKSVETYLQAINAKDATRLQSVSCKEWELDALMMMDSFQAVTTQLEGLSCRQAGSDEQGNAIVACQGKIVASYNGELQEFDLSVQQYLVENSSGEWLVCGIK